MEERSRDQMNVRNADTKRALLASLPISASEIKFRVMTLWQIIKLTHACLYSFWRFHVKNGHTNIILILQTIFQEPLGRGRKNWLVCTYSDALTWLIPNYA